MRAHSTGVGLVHPNESSARRPSWRILPFVVLGACADVGGGTSPPRPETSTASMALTSAAVWTAEENQVSAQFGRTVSAAGDVNNDGYNDVIVGAWFYDNGQSDEGKAFVYLGSATGLATSAAWTAEGDQIGAEFGFAVAYAGDVNGDGYGDVLVGAPYADLSLPDEGAVFLYEGGPSGLSFAPAFSSYANTPGGHTGSSVSSAGDVNGDGYADVAVGSPGVDFPLVDEGVAVVFHGSPTGIHQPTNWILGGGEDGALFGTSVASAGDTNGDGYGDLIVGAPGFDNGLTDQGKAFVFLGSAAGLPTTAVWVVEGGQTGGAFGASVAGPGDVNGDGLADVVIGMPMADHFMSNNGTAQVYYGAGAGPTGLHDTLIGGQVDGYFGGSVAGAGDINGDGFADLVVGADQYDNGDGNEGRVSVFLGSSSGPGTAAAWFGEGNQSDARYGTSVASAGDVDGDGFGDVLVGAFCADNGQDCEGRAYLYSGASALPATTAAWTAESDQTSAQLGRTVFPAGDVNGDGYGDVLAGAPSWDNGIADVGASWIFLGTADGLGTTTAWSVEGDQSGERLGWFTSTALGDVNGDGFGDVVVSADYHDNGEVDDGLASVYLGGSLGLATTSVWQKDGDQAGERFGAPAEGAGDVNGDGFDDLIIGSPGFTNGLAEQGRASLFFGSASGPSVTADWVAIGSQAGAQFGGDSVGAGDVNGDGYGDLIVGASLHDNGTVDEGAAFLFLGSASGPSPTHAWMADSGQGGSQFALNLGSAGDVDGDGFADVVVAARLFDNGQVDEGRVFVYEGGPGGLSPAPAWSHDGDQAGAEFGSRGEPIGDINADGFGDLLVAAREWDSVAANSGAAYIFVGGSTGLSATPAWTVVGDSGASLGDSVSGAGDVNGDGVGDLLLGLPCWTSPESCEGQARLYLGNSGDGTGPLSRRPSARQPSTTTAIPPGLESTADDTFDVSVQEARGPWGKAPVRLQVEVKEAGVPFDGTALWTAPTYADSGLAGINLQEAMTGLDPGTGYHWRVRVAVSPATGAPQGWGPWMAGGRPGDVAGAHLFTAGRDGDGDGGPNVTDCDDADPAIYVGAPEVCDLVDDDCDGSYLEAFPDWDGDTLPDCVDADDDGDGSLDAADCADDDNTRYLGAPELCDSIDSNCDGSLVDSFADFDSDLDPNCVDLDDDGDNDPDATDCADLDSTVHAGALETCDGIDSNCTGAADESDADGDGTRLCAGDCDDGNAGIEPGGAETCDGIDSDCTGAADEVDGDGDGTRLCAGDCNDGEATVYPGAPELCDGLDNDCVAGTPDEGCGDDDSPDDDTADDDTADDDSGDDDSGTQEPPPNGTPALPAAPPGCVIGCGGAAVLPLILWIPLRRRRRGFGGHSLAMVAAFGALSLLPTLALASDKPKTASETAMMASDTFEQWCSKIPGMQLGVGQDEAVLAVTQARLDVSRALARTDEGFLRYWRAVLGECLNQPDGAAEDYERFVAAESRNPTFAGLVADATRRLRRLGHVAPTASGVLARPEPPRALLAIGGGFQSTGTFPMATVGADLRLCPGAAVLCIGPLARVATGGALRGEDGEVWTSDDGETLVPVSVVAGGGILLRAAGPVDLEGSLDLVVMPNMSGVDERVAGSGGALLVGPQIGGGVRIPFGHAPLGLRVHGEFAWLHPSPVARVFAAVVATVR